MGLKQCPYCLMDIFVHLCRSVFMFFLFYKQRDKIIFRGHQHLVTVERT